LLLCLGVKSRALVLNVLAENLDTLKCGGWGVFIAPTTKVAVGKATVDGRTGQSGAPPDTVRCASHVTQLLGFDRWSSDKWGHRTVTVHCLVRLLAPTLTSARAIRTIHCYCTLLQSTVGAVAVAPLAHWTVRCYTGQSSEL
jgi:hypothetical protein